MRGVSKLKRSVLLAHSIFGKRLAFEGIPIFATDRCNSRCQICNIWRKSPKTDLDPEMIKKILEDKVITRYSSFILTGGEFILHPKYREILSLFNQYKNFYILLSNGLLPDRLINTVREFRVKNLSISLDGCPETYRKIRGVDGYSCVERVVKELKDDDLRLSIGYTVSPWNIRDDLLHVINFCSKYRVDLNIGYYCNMEYYDITKPADKLYRVDDLANHPYHRLYPQWSSGNLDMPCMSIFLRPVVRPNGDVELCEPKQIKLGNLHEQSLGEIWLSDRTRELQRKYLHCNACWHDAQRGCDIYVTSILKSFVPSSLAGVILNGYNWQKIYRSMDSQFSNQEKTKTRAKA